MKWNVIVGLVQTIPQMNNFVIYKGFFDDNNGNLSAQDSNDLEAKVSAR